MRTHRVRRFMLLKASQEAGALPFMLRISVGDAVGDAIGRDKDLHRRLRGIHWRSAGRLSERIASAAAARGLLCADTAERAHRGEAEAQHRGQPQH